MTADGRSNSQVSRTATRQSQVRISTIQSRQDRQMESTRPPFRSTASITAIFALAGPLVGLIVIAGPGGAVFSLMLGGLPFVFAYVIGFIPATFTGVMASLSVRKGKVWQFLATAIFSGALTPLAWALAYATPQNLPWLLCLAGGVAGLVCAVLSLPFTGLSIRLPDKIKAAVSNWNAGSVFLVIMGAVCTVLLGCIGLMLFG